MFTEKLTKNTKNLLDVIKKFFIEQTKNINRIF